MKKPDREIFIRRSHRQLGADVAQGSGGATALRGCTSRRTNPVVLRRRFLLQLGRPCAEITTPGDSEGSVPNPTPSSDYIPLGRRRRDVSLSVK
jgi:hypothetical protein